MYLNARLPHFCNKKRSLVLTKLPFLISDFQGDFASQNMMRSIARQVCEQLVNSEQKKKSHKIRSV